MLNLRQVTTKYYLSGGWQDIDYEKGDPLLLKYNNIGAVLDLQFTENDSTAMALNVAEELSEYDIEYDYIQMSDMDNYAPSTLAEVFEEGHEILTRWEETLPKNKKILVKCGMGKSRSPAMLMYHLCKKDNLSFLAVRRLIDTDFIPGLGISLNIQFEQFLKTKFPFK